MYFYTNVLPNDFFNPETKLFVWTKEDDSYSESDVKVYVDIFNIECYSNNKSYAEVKYKHIKWVEEVEYE